MEEIQTLITEKRRRRLVRRLQNVLFWSKSLAWSYQLFEEEIKKDVFPIEFSFTGLKILIEAKI